MYTQHTPHIPTGRELPVLKKPAHVSAYSLGQMGVGGSSGAQGVCSERLQTELRVSACKPVLFSSHSDFSLKSCFLKN